MSKNDTTKQLGLLKLNQTRFLTDLRFKLQALKDDSAEAVIQSKCDEIDIYTARKNQWTK